MNLVPQFNVFEVKLRAQGFWIEERIQIVKDMAADKATSRQIAERVGCTKNAVIGLCKRHRIVLNYRVAHPITHKRKPRLRAAVARSHGWKVPPIMGEGPKDLPTEPHSDSWQEFRYVIGCRWPVLGEPGPEMMCCGAKQEDNCSYCEYHRWKSMNIKPVVEAKTFGPVPPTELLEPDAA